MEFRVLVYIVKKSMSLAKSRVFPIFFISALVILFLMFLHVVEKYDAANSAEFTAENTIFIEQVSHLINSMQKERALSSDFIISSKSWYKEILIAQREAGTQAYKGLIENYEAMEGFEDALLTSAMTAVKQHFYARDLLMKKADRLQLSYEDNRLFYDDIISKLLEIVQRIGYINMERGILLPNMQAFSELILAKEFSARERVDFSDGIAKGVDYKTLLKRDAAIHGQMLLHLENFEQKASPELLRNYHSIIDRSLSQRLNNVFANASSGGVFVPAVDEKEWFSFSADYLNQMDQLITLMLQNFHHYADGVKKDAMQAFWISMALWSALLLVFAMLGYLLRRSVIKERSVLDQLDREKQFCSLLAEADRLTASIHDEKELCRWVCHTIVKNSRFDFAWFALVDKERQLLQPYVSDGVPISHLPVFSFDVDDAQTTHRSTPLKAYFEERTVVEQCEGLAHIKECASLSNAADIKLVISFPIKKEQETVVLLNLYSRQSQADDFELSQLIEPMVNKLSFAFENIGNRQSRSEMQEKLRITEYAFDSQEAILVTDAQVNIIMVNQALCDISGYSESELLGKNPRILRSDRQDDSFFHQMWRELNKNGSWKGEIYNRRKNGEVYPGILSIAVIKDDENSVCNYMAHFFDISEIKEAQSQVEYQAHHDFLTKLPNRILLQEHLKQAFRVSKRANLHSVFMYIDLDRFKQINDNYGHDAGDRVLVEIAQRMRDLLREGDMVARIGGDEFAVIAPDLDVDESSAANKALFLAEKILTAVTEPVRFESYSFEVTASIGIKLFPNHVKDELDVIEHADIAMYQAKKMGRNQITFYNHDLDIASRQFATLENELVEAIKKDEFMLYYQPTVCANTERIIGAEALLRWKHPTKGVLAPSEFIGVLEKTSLMHEVCPYVLRSACMQIEAWLRAKRIDRNFRLAINISAHCFRHKDFVKRVESILDEFSFNHAMLEFELVESVLIEDMDDTVEKIKALQKRNISFLIDDFGTGYTSMRYLQQLPVDGVKIDRAILSNVNNKVNQEIIKITIDLANTFNLEVIAEGVESSTALKYLRDLNCHFYQGYSFSRPVKHESFISLFQENNKTHKRSKKSKESKRKKKNYTSSR